MSIIKRVSSGLLIPTFLLAAAGFMVSPQAAAQPKIGFVNVAKVLDDAPQAEDARQSLEREFAPRDRDLLKQQKEVRTLEDELIKNGAVMAERERERKESRIRSQKRELRRLQEEFREDLNLRRNQELAKLQRQVIEVIQQFAKDQKYDMIVGDGVLYAGDRVDVTKKVIEQLRRQFKKSAGK